MRVLRVLFVALALVVAPLSFLESPARAHTDTTASEFFVLSNSNRGVVYKDPKLRQDTGSAYLHWDYDYVASSWPNTNPQPELLYPQFRRLSSNGTYCAGSSWANLANGADWFPLHNASPIGAATEACPKVEVRYIGVSSSTVYLRAKTTTAGEGPDAPTALQVLSTSPGGKILTYDQVAALALRAGFSREDAAVAVAVARAESSFRTKAISYTGCCYGLWQVNAGVHGTTQEAMFDPVQNSVKALAIFDQANGWTPWEAFTLGMHSQFLEEAEAAVARQVASSAQAFYSIGQAPSSGTGSVTLGWTTTCAGCSYRVERATSSSGPWSLIGSPANLVFTDNSAAAGTTYYYRVSAHNAQGTSSPSTAVGVTTGAADPSEGIPEGYTGPSGDGAINPDAGTTDEGDGLSCGWNMFCWIKAALRWAFVPGEGTTSAWEGFYDDVSSRPPWSVAVSAQDFVSNLGTELGRNDGESCVVMGDSDGSLDLCDDVGNFDLLRAMFAAAIYFGLGFGIWRRASAALGSKPDAEAAA